MNRMPAASRRGVFALLVGLQWCVVLAFAAQDAGASSPMSDLDASNARRRELGIREVKPTWVVSREEYFARDWTEQKGGPSIKRAQYREEWKGPVEEEDYYWSGKTPTRDTGGTIFEKITIRYNYDTKTYFVFYNGTDVALRAAVRPYLVKGAPSLERVLPVIDATLKEWGLSRL